MFSAARIQTIRKSKGFSQELLAEHSGVSLRTIQRVEQGDTVPRGYTLQALAAALDVPLELFHAEPISPPLPEPTQEPPPVAERSPPLAAAPAPADASAATQLAVLPAPSSSVPARQPLWSAARPALRPDPEFVQLLNLSALSLLVLPLLNLLVPLWLWRRRRHTTAHVAEVGRRVLGFQVLWQVGSFLAYLLLLLAHTLAASHHWPMWRGGYLEIFIGSYVLNVAAVCYSAVQLRRGNLDIYPLRL